MLRLSQKQKNDLKKISQKFGLKFIIVFGSYALEKENKKSDLDIALYFRKETGNDPRAFGKILFELQEVFGGKDVDLSFLNFANPLFRYEAAVSGKLLYGNEMDFLNFKAFSFRDFVDSADLRNLENSLVQKRQKILKKVYG